MIYLDANVFVYSALNRKALGEKSRSIIRHVQAGRIKAVTSALSFDELVWAVKKQRGESDGIIAGEIFLNMPGLQILEVRLDILNSALSLLKKYHLNPRDSIHAASGLNANVEFIVSEDPDFDALASVIKRKSILRTPIS
ncbi:MAG: type II toxin-antitoxin system VapC family toxin [Thaumarchaeota archaeon]|nr:type II toxin-antitoxin system VapC family toxin [Nitrososphaerota archaeon]